MNLEFGKPYHHKSIDQCRMIGRIGGLRAACNRRLCRLAQPPVPAATSPAGLERESAHQASLILDAKFPHLRDAWGRPVLQRPA